MPELETLIPNSPGIPAVEMRFGVARPYRVTTKRKVHLFLALNCFYSTEALTLVHFCFYEPVVYGFFLFV